VAAVGDAERAAGAVLVDLGAADDDDEPVAGGADVGKVEGDEFAAAQRTGGPE